MTVTREQIVAAARSWIGTPVKHQGQSKGVSCDCKGLVCGVAAELDLPEAQSVAALVRDYPVAFHGRQLFGGLGDSMVRVRTEPAPGDVLAILWGRDQHPRHLALLSAPGWMIHAYGGGIARVAEVPLNAIRVHSIWMFPSLLVEADG